MAIFKPMLSATVEDPRALRYPLVVSPKLDGIRAIVMNGNLVSRSLKPIPNLHCQTLFGRPDFEGLDGELVCGDPTASDVFNKTTSAVMSIEGEPDVIFYVFDNVWEGSSPFYQRLAHIERKFRMHPRVHVVPHVTVQDYISLNISEQLWLDQGYEGLMARDPAGLYKFGRSTLKEQGLMKLKRFFDAEARILGFEEQMQNDNESIVNALGNKERSTKKAGMRGKGTLGAIKVVGTSGTFANVEFHIGSGFNDELRDEIWKAQDKFLGQIVKFKYFELGSKDAPRFPVFLGFRDTHDIT